jgi:hypothetical protein
MLSFRFVDAHFVYGKSLAEGRRCVSLHIDCILSLFKPRKA